jgi:hypothetical protein
MQSLHKTFTEIADDIANRNINNYYNRHSFVMTEDGYEVSDNVFPDPDFDQYYALARHEAFGVIKREIRDMAQTAQELIENAK